VTSRAVTDSHALIWYALGRPHKLGRQARRAFARADAGSGVIYVPTVVLVEVLEAARLGVLRFEHGAGAWTRRLFGSGNYLPVDLTVEIVLRADDLYAIRERGDRLVAATAASLDLPLLTRDPGIAKVAGVRTVW
jgi:PIN domain nuclease of toxin-antitoxin system